MKARIFILSFVMSIGLVGCNIQDTKIEDGSSQDVIPVANKEEQKVDDLLYEGKINELLNRIEDLENENNELKSQISNIKLDLANYQSQGNLEDQVENFSMGNSEMITLSELEILNLNIRRLYELTGQDPYEFMDYRYEDRIEVVTDFRSLMNNFSYNLDGVYSEGFSFQLGEVYRKLQFKEFMDELSSYDDKIIDILCGYLIYDLFYREDEITKLESSMALNQSDRYEYAYSRFKYYINTYK